MKFGPVPLDQAAGKILAHHVARSTGGYLFKKGKPLFAEEVEELRRLGRKTVYVAELEPGDIDEDLAASRVGGAAGGSHLNPTRANVGRVNLQAACQGVLYVDTGRLLRLNEIEGITAATQAAYTVVSPRQTVATIKIIPFAIPESRVRLAEGILAEGGPLLDLRPLPSRRVALILSASPQAQERVGANFIPPIQKRIEAFGSQLSGVTTLPILEESAGEMALMSSIRATLEAGAEVIVLAGETAVMDRQDMAPRAVEGLGGRVILFGAPVDPGSLLMLAYIEKVPILGAPGCARSLKPNIMDWVLPRLLAGERLSRGDILVLGHGGLLEGLQEGVSWRERLPED